MTKNILFIMCDQLRFDYLGCTGHRTIKTPYIDALAKRGVRFDRAYVQSPICGPSRMSTYTGRYVTSHGSTWNMAPLRVGEMNIGDHLNPLGMRTVLCGKTHMVGDNEGMKRLGVDPQSALGTRIGQCGFEVFDRLDGVHPPKSSKKPTHYNDNLRARGMGGDSPWQDWSATVTKPDGSLASGWMMKNLNHPARVPAEHSETVYTTTRAMEFIDTAGEQPWCLHLSYIKPHWPYVAPAPYNDMYGPDDIQPVIQGVEEKDSPHPVLGAFQQHRVSQNMARAEVRKNVIPAYMGLITQLDDEIGRLMAFLEERGLSDDTLIVFTSDHGDYMGDHWLGEKEFFHEPSVKIPLIICDPSPKANATRGMVRGELVESIDLLPTFVEIAGGQECSHVLEGKSLVPLLHSPEPCELRNAVFSEYDYSCRLARQILDRDVPDCRLHMVFDGRWKMIRAEGFRPMLFDLETDPKELEDIADRQSSAEVILRLTEMLLSWSTRHHNRVTRVRCAD